MVYIVISTKTIRGSLTGVEDHHLYRNHLSLSTPSTQGATTLPRVVREWRRTPSICRMQTFLHLPLKMCKFVILAYVSINFCGVMKPLHYVYEKILSH